MYTNNTTDNEYPKTLIIRNEHGGLIWQLYHVQKEREAWELSHNAKKNRYQAVSLEDYKPEMEETWPNWRKTEGGRQITKEVSSEIIYTVIPYFSDGVEINQNEVISFFTLSEAEKYTSNLEYNFNIIQSEIK